MRFPDQGSFQYTGYRRAHVYLCMKEPWLCWVCLCTKIHNQWRTVAPALLPVQHVSLLRGWGGGEVCPVYCTICSVQPNRLILTHFKGNEVKTSEVTLTLHKIFAVSDVMKKRSRDHLPGFLLTPKCTSFYFCKYQKVHHCSVPGSSRNPPLKSPPASSALQLSWHPWITRSSSYPHLTSWVPRMPLCTLRELYLPGHSSLPYIL